eukprot:TRINITY_DN55321_c0_g1_i1.p1 TRINITY_DN55321_c0_g1~~TRINITY_DN55321_c0_g1_i1.p1  ORF type:complete len:421 (+),score=157.52 TRINITY_DN55321_c0_g1_i1:108-1265(+)
MPNKVAAGDEVRALQPRRCLLACGAWARDHTALAITLFVAVSLASIHLWKMYIYPSQDVIRWIGEQTLNPTVNATGRLPAKYRMLNPTLLFVDYPICRWLAVDVGLREVSFFTANFVSLVHPIFGVLAAVALAKAAVPPEEELLTPRDVERGFSTGVTPRKSAEGEVRVWLVQLAVLLFTIRNTLDTLDGVMARARAGGRKLETGIGMNGHVLDVATDMLGVTVFLCSVWVHFFRLRIKLERHSLPGLREVVARLYSPRGPGTGCVDAVWCSRLLVFVGVAMTCITGLSWETTMLKMQDIFDRNTGNVEVMELERAPVVQVCYFLWSLTCSDAQFFYIIVAALLGYLHDFMCVLAVYGWAWLAVLSLFSAGVTDWLRAHPTVAAI